MILRTEFIQKYGVEDYYSRLSCPKCGSNEWYVIAYEFRTVIEEQGKIIGVTHFCIEAHKCCRCDFTRRLDFTCDECGYVDELDMLIVFKGKCPKCGAILGDPKKLEEIVKKITVEKAL